MADPEIVCVPVTAAAQRGPISTPLTVLRVSHSGVIDAWRRREQCLRALGVHVTLASARRWEEAGRTVVLAPVSGEAVVAVRTFGRHPCGFVYDPLALFRLLRSTTPDLIDVHEEPYSLAAGELLVLRWLARLRAPIVLYSAQNLDKQRSLPIHLLEQAVLRRVSGIYPCSTGAASVIRRKGFRGVLRVLPLGVDIPASDWKSGRELGSTTKELHVGYAGRLAPEKGVHVLLEAVVREPSWQLSFAGDGPECTALVNEAAAAGAADRVHFLGSIDHAALAQLYDQVDVLAVPSLPTPNWMEQFCRVAVEAMAAGTPVVASDSGALPEVVGDAGLLIPPGDPDALHAALARLTSHRDVLEALGEAGRHRATRFTWESVATGQLAFYEAVLRREARATPEDRVLPPLEAAVVAYGRPDLLPAALAPLAGAPVDPIPTVVVDNSSSVRSVAVSHGARYLDIGTNRGFAGAVNRALAARLDPASDLLLVNPDASIDAATARVLQRRLHGEARLACVAPAQIDGRGRPQRVAWPFPAPRRAWREALGLARHDGSGEFLVGSVLLLNAAAIAAVGPFDEGFFLYAEEADWQLRARRAGWGARYVPDVGACHIGAATSSDAERREALFAAAQERFIRKWYGSTGWATYRAAVIAGAAARSVLLPRQRAVAARERAQRYLRGPRRLARPYLPEGQAPELGAPVSP